MTRAQPLPWWIEFGLLPLINLTAAFIVSGLVMAALGHNPFEALSLMITGAFGSADSVGYTLYYTTNFIFTGLAVALASHAGLFNIGAEGQAMMGGLGAALVGLALTPAMPGIMAMPLAIGAAMLLGGIWGAIPGWMQAYRGSHVVITTIMMNFLAGALLTYLLVDVLIAPGGGTPESRPVASNVWLPAAHELAAVLGLDLAQTPLNLSLLLGLICAAAMGIFLWRTRWGFALRAVGLNPSAALYAGISPSRMTVIAMALSGALAGLVGANEILGAQHRLVLGFTGGYGFVGIAVALMGRNRPLGVILASLLFGALYQGGSELALDMPGITRDLVVMVQGLIILFCGALENIFRSPLTRMVDRLNQPRTEPSSAAGA
jgi:simple sugar transport system permease protein